jgi:hypothetical protein
VIWVNDCLGSGAASGQLSERRGRARSPLQSGVRLRRHGGLALEDQHLLDHHSGLLRRRGW